MLLISQKHNPTSFKVIINNHSISPEEKLKYLGVLLENKLSWKPHVQKLKTQLSRACGIISKLKHYTTKSVLKVVYNSLIHPYLNYSILNWGRASNATIQPLIKLQNKAIKIIKPTNTKSLEELFQLLNTLSLPKIYTFSVGKLMHSYHNKLLPNHFDEYFIPISSIHSHSTRLATSDNLFLPRVNSSSGKFSLIFVGPKVWSSIPNDIKFSTTFTFKQSLRTQICFFCNSIAITARMVDSGFLVVYISSRNLRIIAVTDLTMFKSKILPIMLRHKFYLQTKSLLRVYVETYFGLQREYASSWQTQPI